MQDKIIIIKDDKDFKCNSFKEIVKFFFGTNYYDLSDVEKNNKIVKLAIDVAYAYKLKITSKCENLNDLENSFFITDEMTAILSLLKSQLSIVLLERSDSNIFNKYINNQNSENNYVIVNKFAKEILKKYLKFKC